ncbi:hypothetical protein F5J12DRAFT_780540 [Pisolithus orientalis]|uniref:uncharacterized protein n=1 Tax=Pisolithus orientalis TaxID=936130 RepID=UPI0022257A49|nr:uncharacterized protein F5J12DRAFT_780540 [Pisolithus orientalis]KAI6025713.1 hypothetical protein F5J12DRAFT_780540 [Pisolithus orientalis]
MELSLKSVEVMPSQHRQVKALSIDVPTTEVEHALNGHLEVEVEVVPCEAGSGQMDEPEDTNLEMSNSHTDKTSTIGMHGQLIDMTRDLHLLEPGSETFNLTINSTNLEDSCIIETTLQMPVRNDQHIQTCSGLIANAVLTSKPKCLEELQEAKWPQPKQDCMQVMQQETYEGQHTWKVSIDETGGVGEDGEGTSH